MKNRLRYFPVLLFLILGMVMVASGFHYFRPLHTITYDGERVPLGRGEVLGIIPNEEEGTFFVELADRTVASREKLSVFQQRARFNRFDYESVIRTEERRIDRSIGALDQYPCDRYVEGYDVFKIRGFVYVDPNYFIVIHDQLDFSDCPCDDPKVIDDRDPNCPHIHHRTKQAIVERARACGLGDWFPMERCHKP